MPGPKIDFSSEDDRMTGLEALKAEMSAAIDRRNSISSEEVEIAIATAIEALRTGWTTGAGRRLQSFVWSLWNGYHFINLFELSHGLDGRLTDAVIVLFRAAMVDVLTEHWAEDIPGRIENVRSGLTEHRSAEGRSSIPIVCRGIVTTSRSTILRSWRTFPSPCAKTASRIFRYAIRALISPMLATICDSEKRSELSKK
jgi:hypothetical protein